MYKHFYFPDRVQYGTPEAAGLLHEAVFFRSADGTTLSGWFIPAVGMRTEEAHGTVVHMHGNAQNMSAHWGYAQWLPAQGFNLFTFDYRGYGQSHGQPDPRGIFDDAVAALEYVRTRPDIDAARLFVFGQSLGGMLAIAAAAASPQGIGAVLSEAPVHSYQAWADDVMPEKELALDDTHCASAWVEKLAPIPLMLVHGTADRVVPHEHSERLLAAAGEPKHLVTVPGGEHNDAMTDRHGTTYQDMLVEFFRMQGKLSPFGMG